MKQQEKSSVETGCAASGAREVQAAYRTLDRLQRGHPWLVQGSVNDIAPKTPGGSVTYTWTRKVRAKTVTVALSKQQAAAFRRAVAANRQVEAALAHLREASQVVILSSLPGAPKRHPVRSETDEPPNVPNGLK